MPENLDGAGGVGNEPIATEATELPTLVCGMGEVRRFRRSTFQQTELTDGSSFCWISDYRGGVDSIHGDGTHWPRAQLFLNSRQTWEAKNSANPDYGITCLPKDCFFSNGGSADRRVISEGNIGAQSSGLAIGGCQSASANAWWGDAATVLNGWDASGLTTMTGDRAFVTQNNLSNQPSTVTNRDCTFLDGQNSRRAETTSLFVGIPGGNHQAVFRGPNSTRSHGILNAGDYVSKSWDTTNIVSMAFVDEGICYFSYLAGDFHLPEDGAEIYPVLKTGRWRWVLRTIKSSGGNNSTTGVRAHARCYLFDQSQ